jgi:hypothetical protein
LKVRDPPRVELPSDAWFGAVLIPLHHACRLQRVSCCGFVFLSDEDKSPAIAFRGDGENLRQNTASVEHDLRYVRVVIAAELSDSDHIIIHSSAAERHKSG